MSVLINGMEMPKENDYTIAIVYGDGVVAEYHEDYWIRGVDGEKQLGIAVPVPPHGRLIDADALGEFPYNMDFCDGGEADEWVQNAPTIIQAEEGET